jgi:hypoxanthine phosphoribosyltransferase
MPPLYTELLDHVLIDQQRLQARIAELGKQISEDYKSQNDLTLVGILKGSTPFLIDLMRCVEVPHIIDFMDVSSYGIGARSSGDVRILMDLDTPIEGRHVLIVEDIVDSGKTLQQVLGLLSARRPASLSVCALLDKKERREVDVPIRYVGFTIPNVFVFGFGLDIDEYYRNLPFVGVARDGAYIAPEHQGQ